jgi:ribosomal protein L37E
MIIALSALLAIGVLLFILSVRAKDLPEPAPVSPFQHLDEKKAAIYENLRDLNFEFRVGKLSDQDYQQTKTDLQRELAGVLAEIDKIKQQMGVAAVPKSAPSRKSGILCLNCGASFSKDLKYCGECGKPMKARA